MLCQRRTFNLKWLSTLAGDTADMLTDDADTKHGSRCYTGDNR